MKQPNKEGLSSAEVAEGGTSPEGNGGETTAARTLQRDTRRTDLSPCAERRDRARVCGSCIVQGAGFGLVGDLVLGVIGAFIGTWMLPQMGVHLGAGLVAAIANATVGAMVLML